MSKKTERIKDYLIEGDKLILHASERLVIYVDEHGKIYQRIICYFINGVPVWNPYLV